MENVEFSCPTKSPHSAKNEFRLRIVLWVSAFYFFAELLGGYLSGSLALLADAGHMLIDVASMALSLFAIWMSKKPATEEKTYGYHRVEILAALANGATLVAIAAWILTEAWGRLHTVKEVQAGVMFWVSLGGLLVNIFGMSLLRHTHGSNLRSVWLHLLTDTLGSVSACLGAIVIGWTGWTLIDPLLAVPIAFLILFGAWKLITACVNVLLEGVPEGIELSKIREGIQLIPKIKGLHDLHVWTLTSGVPALSAHVKVEDGTDHKTILEYITEYLCTEHQIEHVTIQIEPVSFSHHQHHEHHGH